METHAPMEGDRLKVLTPEQKRRKLDKLPYGNVRKENDDEVWSRKLAESEDPEQGRYVLHHDPDTGAYEEGSLADSVERKGITSPLHLGVSEITDRPTVFGGHHRLVSAYSRTPDRLQPVLHHASVKEAKRPYESGFPYR